MIGELFCYACPEPQIKIDDTEIGALMQPTALRNVVRRVCGGFILSCKHFHLGFPMTSAQEWLLLPSGEVVRGKMELVPTRRS